MEPVSPPEENEEPVIENEEMRPEKRISSFSLISLLPPVCLVILALALRLWGIHWGLPNQERYLSYHPDEGVNLVQGVLENGVPHPHLDLNFYNYGGLYFYLWQGSVAINRAYGAVSLPATGQPNVGIPDSPAAMILVGRYLTVLLGALTAWAVFALGNRLFGRACGWIAGAIYAILPAAVVHGHYATVDVPATFFVTVGLVYGARLLASRGNRDAALAGLFCGLAGATKYNVIIVALAPLAALYLRRKLAGGVSKLQPWVFTGATVGGFVLGCAGLLVNWEKFTSDFSYELDKSRQGMGLLFADTGNGWLYHLTSSLRFGMGIPMLLLTLVALALAFRKRTRQDWYLLAFLIPYYLVIGWSQVRFLRYTIPLYPVFAVFIGRLMTEPLTDKKAVVTGIRAVGAVAAAITLLISMAMNRMMTLPDTRDQAVAYALRPGTEGKTIGFVTLPWYYSPPIVPGFTAPSPKTRYQGALAFTRNPLLLPSPDTEWPKGVIAGNAPDMFAVSEFEIGDAARIHFAPAQPFFDLWRTRYTPRVFEKTPAIFGVDFGKPDYVPNDWLYPYPRTIIYERHS